MLCRDGSRDAFTGQIRAPPRDKFRAPPRDISAHRRATYPRAAARQIRAFLTER
jgi:hypothetical protein